ncbi:rhamnan synthesis F family protein, partial [Solemya elarraichensis gill symbiont]
MPQFWKVRREMTRIADQFLAVPTFIAEVLWYEALHMFSRRQPRRYPGQQVAGKDVAIFLLYQPGGILASTVETCRHLVEQGYSIRIISNAPVSEVDRGRLAPYCQTIIERQNHGYDFGGYQFAINELLTEEVVPENLLLINDSIWFPVLTKCDLLQRLRSSAADFSGPVIYRHRKEKKTHLQSYMLHFRQSAIVHPAFRNFWSNYRKSSSKRWTIRYGEMRLT